MTSGSAASIAMHWLALVAGLGILAVATREVMASMLVPRATRARLVHYMDRAANRTVRWVALRRPRFETRDHVLSYVVPVALVYLLLSFVLAYMAAFGLLTWAFGGNLGGAFYEAGATLTTLGFVGDPNAGQVVVGLVAALVGLALVAVLIGYLLALYGAYGDRERVVAELGQLAGEPAWGPEMLCRSHLIGDAGGALGYDASDLRDWMIGIRTLQTASPLLNHMRTPIPQRSWAVTLIAVTDAAALRVTAVEGGAGDVAAVRLVAEGSTTLAALEGAHLYRSGRGSIGDLSSVAIASVADAVTDDPRLARVMRSVAIDASLSSTVPGPGPDPDPRISRDDWESALALLEAAGITLVADRDRAWHRFSAIRAAYASSAEALVNRLYSVRAPWTGPRTPETDVVWPHLAMDPGHS